MSSLKVNSKSSILEFKRKHNKLIDEVPSDEDIKLLANETFDEKISSIINMGQLISGIDTESSPNVPFAYFSKEFTTDEWNKIPDNGLIIVMFNTTTAILPYVKSQENRTIMNVVISALGVSMVSKVKILFSSEDAKLINVVFDEATAQAFVDASINPYGIIRFFNL